MSAAAALYGLLGLGLSSPTGASASPANSLVGLVFLLIAILGLTAVIRRMPRLAVGAAAVSLLPPLGLLALIPIALIRIGEGEAKAQLISAGLESLLPAIVVGVIVAAIPAVTMLSGALAMRRRGRSSVIGDGAVAAKLPG